MFLRTKVAKVGWGICPVYALVWKRRQFDLRVFVGDFAHKKMVNNTRTSHITIGGTQSTAVTKGLLKKWIFQSTEHTWSMQNNLTVSLYGKIYFPETIKDMSNLTNVLKTIFFGQTYVPMWLLVLDHFHDRVCPFFDFDGHFHPSNSRHIDLMWPIFVHGG